MDENYYGLTKKEYIGLLKECGMCTKKWTYAKQKQFDERRREILKAKNKKHSFIKSIFKRRKVK